jgi:protocatechuate 3,4-dioxygenase beta subunit
MDIDDNPRGFVLSRREVVALLGAAGYAVLSGYRPAGAQGPATSSSPCVVRPEQTEGPYFVDELLHRADLRTDPADGTIKPGVPLDLTILVSRLAAPRCQPLAGVQVDVWHCDHLGTYSDVEDPSFTTVGRKFLRGYQLTDEQGRAHFTTIYPGWYRGRTVHIHFKLRSPATRGPGFEFTSQLYFDDALTDRVFAAPPTRSDGPGPPATALTGSTVAGAVNCCSSWYRRAEATPVPSMSPCRESSTGPAR